MASFEFAGHILDLQLGRLRRGHADVSLRPKSFSLLAFMVENRGRVVSKDELFSAIWPDIFVSDDSLTQCIADIRRCLGSEARSLIRTVPRRGYILDEADVRVVTDAAGLPRRIGTGFETTIRPADQDNALRMRTQAMRMFEMAPRPKSFFDVPHAGNEPSWREEDDDRWQQRVASYSAFAGVGALAADEHTAQEWAGVQALRNVPMFSVLDTSRLKMVTLTSDRLSLAKGHVLFKQGDQADAAYIVLSGALDAYLELSDRRVHLSRNAENTIIGEMGLIGDTPRSATIIAASDALVLRIAKEVFLNLVAEVPTMALAIMREQIGRLQHAEKRLKELRE